MSFNGTDPKEGTERPANVHTARAAGAVSMAPTRKRVLKEIFMRMDMYADAGFNGTDPKEGTESRARSVIHINQRGVSMAPTRKRVLKVTEPLSTTTDRQTFQWHRPERGY